MGLTPRGRDYARQTIEPLIQGEKRAFAALTPEEQRTLVALTEKTLCHLKEEIVGDSPSAQKPLL